jgi:hypothetical protein
LTRAAHRSVPTPVPSADMRHGIALLLGVLLVVTPAADARPRWIAPVPGPPVRHFDLGPNPFEAGRHRGADLAAESGQPVRSACSGRVVFAGRVAGVGTVSVRCGVWRVSYAPLRALGVRADQRIGAGRRLGAAARGRHPGLHFGVRREGRRFAYVDPLPFISRFAPAPPVAGRRGVRERRPPAAWPLPSPARHVPTVAALRRRSPAVAPWPVWAGLALLLTGLVGAGTVTRPSRSRGGPRAAHRPLRVPR